MAEFIFAYHGGSMPDTPEEQARVMGEWNDWYAAMGDKVSNGGGPCGASQTVSKGGVAEDGGANPLSGFTLVSAGSYDEAVQMAKGCPMVRDGSGSVEVCEIMQM